MKYCPLCAGEYRDAIRDCATCGTALVGSLAEAQTVGSRRTLLWVSTSAREFDAIAGALKDASIPAHFEEGGGSIFGRLTKSESRIHVLRADYERALDIAAAVLADRKPSATKQVCHACGAECSAGFAACPSCRAILKVERVRDAEPALVPFPSPQGSDLKYCPLCHAAYRESNQRCTVCGVDLVPEQMRGQPLDERQRKEKIHVVWRGGDPLAVSEVINLLREAGIRHHVQPTNEHLVFELGMPRPKYAVRVFASDVTRAKELVADISESAPFTLGEEVSLEGGSEPVREARRPAHEWNPPAATIEVWSGRDPALADLLEACLRENQIGARRETEPLGQLHLLVMPADESHAREIIREVREATPPV